MADIEARIAGQGDKIRELKTSKAAKDVIQPEVAKLLALKAEFKAATGEPQPYTLHSTCTLHTAGNDWKPPAAAAAPAKAAAKAATPPKVEIAVHSSVNKPVCGVHQ